MIASTQNMTLTLDRDSTVEIVQSAFDVRDMSVTVVLHNGVVWAVDSDRLAPVRTTITIADLIAAVEGQVMTALYMDTPDGPRRVTLAHPYDAPDERAPVLLLEAEDEHGD